LHVELCMMVSAGWRCVFEGNLRQAAWMLCWTLPLQLDVLQVAIMYNTDMQGLHGVTCRQLIVPMHPYHVMFAVDDEELKCARPMANVTKLEQQYT